MTPDYLVKQIRTISLPRSTLLGVALVTGSLVALRVGLQTPIHAQTPAAPGGVATSLSLWMRADLGLTVGTSITWLDQSASGNTASQTTAANQPVLNSAAINFNPALIFDGANDFLSLAAPALPTGDISYSVIAVARPTSLSNGYHFVFVEGNNMLRQQLRVGRTFGNMMHSLYQSELASGALTAGVPFVLRYRRNNSNGQRFNNRNGLQVGTTIATFDKVNNYQRIGNSNQNEPWNGDIAELIVYQSALTATQYQQIESYLALKYGITLDQTVATNYLDSAAAVIWDAAANVNYRNNLAGIARDDGSPLNQKQSRSINIAPNANLITMGLGTIAVDNLSNTDSFAADNSFLVWGDDAGSVSLATPVILPGGLVSGSRMARIWKVQETGAVGSVRVGVPSTTGGGVPLLLLVSNDMTFDGSDQGIPLSSFTVGSATYLAGDFNFASGQFFTFATPLLQDLSDAPASYGTLLANNGARHSVPGYDSATNTAPLMLGTRIDVETEGQPGAAASGDDTTGIDDEDGVAFPTLVAGQAASLTVTVTNAGPAAALNAWADWNNDGDFADAGEQIATNRAVSNAVNSVPVSVPASASGAIYFRIRLSTQTGLGPTGLALDGEVEDYQAAVLRETDLAISKTDGQADYVSGAPISYTLIVTNVGPSDATGVSVSDPVPAAISGANVSCTTTGTASCGTNGSSGNSVSFTNASLAPGAGNQLTITITGVVGLTATGNLVNTATVIPGANQTDPNAANNTATETDTQGAGISDLAITKTDGQATYVPGTSISYTITVTNAGPSIATAFSLADTVPTSITDVTASCTASGTADCGTNASAGNRVSFTNASLTPGAGHALTLAISGTISPGATGDLLNTASIMVPGGADYSDPNLGNNSASDLDTQAAGIADLIITKTDGQATYVPGTPISYTITVTNAGPSDATGVNVSDPVPAAITGVTVGCAVSGTGNCGANGSAGNNVSFTNASLAPSAGNQLTITITGMVGPTTTGTLVNTATAISGANQTDPNAANNTATDIDTQVTPTIASITPATGPPAGGTPITITGTNFTPGATVTIGGLMATSVVVVDATTITAVTPAHAPGTVEVTVTAGLRSVTRTGGFQYQVAERPLTVTTTGAGTGRVISLPVGIACGVTCSALFPTDALVELVAIPAADATFAGWSGAADCADGRVTLTTDTACTARFARLTDRTGLDLDGDGYGDLVAYAPPPLSIAAGSLFGDRVLVTPSAGVLRAGDFNGDGRSDLFEYDPVTGAWRVAMAGGGSLSGVGAARRSPITIELDGDGRTDLAMVDPVTGEIQLCAATAFPVCAVTLFAPPGAAIYPLDADGNGRGDLLAYVPASGQLQFFLSGVAATIGPSGADLTVADVNSDGRSDLIFVNSATGVATLAMNRPTGFTFGSATVGTGWTLRRVRLNTDAFDDLAAYHAATGTVLRLLSNGDGSFAVIADMIVSNRELSVADLNGDGVSDGFFYDPATGVSGIALSLGSSSYFGVPLLLPPGLTLLLQGGFTP
jgi:uncharacterized repeat protein (TIGR01451 family)